jgi:hypothetical protein
MTQREPELTEEQILRVHALNVASNYVGRGITFTENPRTVGQSPAAALLDVAEDIYHWLDAGVMPAATPGGTGPDENGEVAA